MREMQPFLRLLGEFLAGHLHFLLLGRLRLVPAVLLKRAEHIGLNTMFFVQNVQKRAPKLLIDTFPGKGVITAAMSF